MEEYDLFYGTSRGGVVNRLYIRHNRRPRFANRWILASREAMMRPDAFIGRFESQGSGFDTVEEAVDFALRNFETQQVLDEFGRHVTGWKSLEKDDSKTKRPSIDFELGNIWERAGASRP